jgi:hypothetical protein
VWLVQFAPQHAVSLAVRAATPPWIPASKKCGEDGNYQRDPEQVAEEFDRWLERKRDRGKMTSVAADRLRQVAPAQHHHGIEFLPGLMTSRGELQLI